MSNVLKDLALYILPSFLFLFSVSMANLLPVTLSCSSVSVISYSLLSAPEILSFAFIPLQMHYLYQNTVVHVNSEYAEKD